jgi:hypothetical protein
MISGTSTITLQNQNLASSLGGNKTLSIKAGGGHMEHLL